MANTATTKAVASHFQGTGEDDDDEAVLWVVAVVAVDRVEVVVDVRVVDDGVVAALVVVVAAPALVAVVVVAVAVLVFTLPLALVFAFAAFDLEASWSVLGGAMVQKILL